jgi:hypothetical protein
MKCPHCLHDVFPGTAVTQATRHGSPLLMHGAHKGERVDTQAYLQTCPNCSGLIVDLLFKDTQCSIVYESIRAYPRSGAYPPAPAQVPASIATDYAEANEVLPISAKASAALSRRCLQNILSAHGFTGRDLFKQVEAVLAETDATKALPTGLRENIDAIRNFGNFSAHPISDQTTLQIIEVEPGEAEWCLELLVDMFDHFYVRPAVAAERRAALAEKLSAAGKPPMKIGSEEPSEAEALAHE